MNDEERKQKIFAEVLEEARKNSPIKQENEFSVLDFARNAGIGETQARNIIREKVSLKIFKERKTTKGTFYSVV